MEKDYDFYNLYDNNDDNEVIEDRFEDLYDYDLFDLLNDIDEDICDRSRTELEINPRLAKILAK